MTRRTGTVAALALLAAILAWWGAPAAPAAEPPYPGPTGTRPPAPTRGSQTHADVRAGDEVRTESCGFRPASSALLGWNGEPAGSAAAGPTGCVVVQVRFGPAVVRGGRACPRTATVEGVVVPVHQGTNRLTVNGTGSNGAAREFVHRFNVVCEEAVVAGFSTERRDRTSAAGSDRTVVAARPGTLERLVTLPFTGSGVARWTVVGALLVAVGLGAVTLERRRLRRRHG